MEDDRLPFSWLWALVLTGAALTPVLAGYDAKEAAVQVGFYILLFAAALRLAEHPVVRWSWPDTLFSFFCLWTVFSRFWAVVPPVTDEHVLRFMPAWGIYFLVRQSSREAFDRTAWSVLSILSGLLALYAVLQKIGAEFIPDYAAWHSSAAPFATFGHPDMWTLWLLLFWPFLILSPRWNSFSNGRDWRLVLAVLLGVSLLLAGGAAAGFGLAAQGLVLIGASGSGRCAPGSSRRILVAWSAALLMIGLMVGVFSHGDFKDRRSVWKAAVQMAWDKPLTGWGANHFPVHFHSYQPAALAEKVSADPEFAKRVHNELLESVVELGLVGLALLAWFWSFWARDTWKGAPSGWEGPWPGLVALAGCGTAAFFSDALRQPGTVFFAWLGGAWWTLRVHPAKERVLPKAAALGLAALLALGAAWMAYTQSRSAYTGLFVPVGRSFLEHLPADLPGRAKELESLLANHKGKTDEWKYHHELGNVYTKMGRLKAAEGEFRTAIQMNNASVASFINLGNVFVLESKEDAVYIQSAVVCYSEAIKRDPASVEAHFNLAYAYFLDRRMTDALRELDEVLKRQGDHARALQLKRMIVP